MDVSSRVEEILDELVSLPSLPGTVSKINSMLGNPDVGLPDIGKVIAQDPSLSIKALRLVNSAFYGLREKATSVERAIILLGLKPTRNLVMTAAVFDTLQCGEQQIIRHSIAAATGARLLARDLGPKSPFEDPDEAFMYGLLHDVGKIVIRQYMEKEWDKILPAISNGISAYEAETKEIGIDHAELGAVLARRWKLADELTGAILGHHDLSRCTDDEQRKRAACVGIIDWMCYEAGYPALEGAMAGLDDRVWKAVGISREKIVPVIQQLREADDSVTEMVNLAA